jgi:putative protein kinase ArgK-like GTPase of G3E family
VTAGAGQGDTAVHALADVTVLLLQPEMGDDLQWQKAGLLEVADVLVIHKSDLPQAEQVEAQVCAMLTLAGSEAVPVLRVSSKTGEGVEALWTAIAARRARRTEATRDRLELLRLAQETVARWFSAAEADRHAELQQLLRQWQQGTLAAGEVANALLRFLQKEYGS